MSFPTRAERPSPGTSRQALSQEIHFLSDDLEQGREEPERPEDVTIQLLIEEVPENVIYWLKQYGVQPLGQLKVSSEVALNFRLHEDVFLTCGSDEERNLDWKSMWRQQLRTRRAHHLTPADSSSSPGLQRKVGLVPGWVSSHQLNASVVTVKHASKMGHDGLLSPILRRAQAGATDVSVFELKAVRAVISFKWRMYGQNITICKLCVFSIWVLSFSVFTAILCSGSFRSDGQPCQPHLGSLRMCGRDVAMGALGLSTLAFIPFLLLELCILRIYSLWYCITYKDSLQEFATVIIHMIITAIAMSSGTKDPSQIAGSFDTLVALQSLFLWMGLSAHFRGFKLGLFEPLELVRRVLWQIKPLILFVGFLMVGFALAFRVLFRLDNDSDQDYSSLPHSFVSLLLLMGGLAVNVQGMYDSNYSIAKIIFLHIFQVMVSTVILNILLAVIVQIFDEAHTMGKAHQIRRRAEIMDEIDSILGYFGCSRPEWNPAYLHILEMDPVENATETVAFVSMPAYKRHAQIKEMIESVAKELMCKIDELPQQLAKDRTALGPYEKNLLNCQQPQSSVGNASASNNSGLSSLLCDRMESDPTRQEGVVHRLGKLASFNASARLFGMIDEEGPYLI